MSRWQEFRWPCYDDARWIESKAGPLILARSENDYAPARDDLFVLFAALAPTNDPAKEKITAWVKFYGLLGVSTIDVRADRQFAVPLYSTLAEAQAAAKSHACPVETTEYKAEPLSAWVKEITDMRHALHLYRIKRLRDFWELVNAKIKEHVAPRFTVRGELTDGNLEPRNLLGLLWLQLALKSRGRWSVQPCRYCREPMAVRQMKSPRPSRLTCSAVCRVSLSRLRARWRAGDLAITDIARTLKTTRATAERWMREA